MPMKNILIICDVFPPQFGPRMGYLCKYLKRLGWSAYVVTSRDTSTREDFKALSNSAEEVHVVPQKQHRSWNPLHLLALFWPYDYLRGEYDLRAKALTLLKEHSFDIVLSSITFGMFPAMTAAFVAHKARVPFVLDIRDLAEQCVATPLLHLRGRAFLHGLWGRLRRMERCYRNRLIRNADAVVTVSDWHRDLLSGINPHTYTILNGFDPEMFHELAPKRSDVFKIVYTGTLGSRQIRDPELLFLAVKQLADEGFIKPSAFRIEFYCGCESGGHVGDCAKKIGVEGFCRFYDFVASVDVPKILQTADILLVLANRSSVTHGTLTTKFFEYLAVNRPVLCVRSDESCLEEVIRDTNAGMAGRSVEDVYGFLKEKISEWKISGVVGGTTQLDKIRLYSREYQAREFVKVFESLQKQ